MARILFLMRYPLRAGDNLKSKFDGQMNAARALGHEALCIAWDKSGMWLTGGGEPVLLRRCPFASLPGYAKTVLYVDLMAALLRVLGGRKIDLVYMRFMPVFHNAPRALRRAKAQGAKLVVEHPTYPFSVGRLSSPLRAPVFAYNERVFQRIEPMIDLYALNGEPVNGTLNGRPAMNFQNGVDVESLPLHSPNAGRDVHMLALASMSRWHGYDRLIEALAAYGGNERITIHMVGGASDGTLADWQRLSETLGVSDRVVFHGARYGGELEAIIQQCDIGVGGLRLYLKKQFVNPTLKLREYMARGLPFVYAVEDPAIPDDPRVCLRVPNDGSPLDMARLAAFAQSAKTDAETPARMRQYAREHMAWTGALRPILERVGLT